MAGRSFVHLHCHSHYSLLDGASRIPELVETVKGQGMNAIALTDHGNLYGAIEFYKECRAAGLNPIIGYEAYVAPGKRSEREARRRGEAGFHLTLLAKNSTGFRNLIKMASLAFTEGYHYVPRIDKELMEHYHEGIICLSGCASAEFSDYILKEQLDEATELARWFHKIFGNDFYIEIQNNGLEIQRLCAEGAIDIANRLGLPLVATSDAHYLRQDDATAHEVLLCINTRKTIKDPNRMRFETNQFHIRPPEEMYKLFPGHEEAVKRSQEIADSVDIEIDFTKRHFPVFAPPRGKTAEDYLRELCEAGARERYGDPLPQRVIDRLEHELNIINKLGFASYFLIVWDFVRFAIENGIPNSARGSACGALVSYALKLSHVDPLQYDLLFERFLDPNRKEAPDIDIDFCQERREAVIQYVRQKYGEESVAQIATFGTMAARAAIKDVGRVLEVPLDRVNKLTSMIPKTLGITIDDALKQSQELRNEYENDPQVHELFDVARRLEGTNRNAGTHAAGVVIANGPITDYVPVHRVISKSGNGSKDSEAVITTQWVMGDLEKVGMLKMDFLGLRTLTLLDNCIRLIEKTRGEKIDLQKLPLDDRKTYELLQRGDAKGVFQLESEGIRELLKRMKPDSIRDIIAIMALYRPGPLGGGMVDAYINCKHGREQPHYAHPVMKEVLAETYGVMVYQEQIMRILNRLGGIELSSAYQCIKAISKKKHDIINQRKAEFLKGAKEGGVSEEVAQDVFDKIVFFGGYGFNKCLIGSTRVIDAKTGEPTTIGDLFRNRRQFYIHSLGTDYKLHRREVVDVVWNGQKPVFALQTRQGKRIVATANHPFYTLEGWKRLDELQPGDRIATPRQLSIASTASWPRHEIIALAGLLSEGNTCHPTSLYFYGNDRVLVEEFAQVANNFPNTVARIDTRNGKYEVCANMGRDWRQQNNSAVPYDSNVLIATPPCQKPTRSGMFQWAERMHLLKKKATEKRVPESVFSLCDDDLALFLGRLWAGDGFIASSELNVPYYATSSAGLAWDVQTLLLRFGILSGVHEKRFKYKGGIRIGYTVHVFGNDSIKAFVERIACHCLGREKQVELLTDYRSATQSGLTSKDTIPSQIRNWVNQERDRMGITWKDLQKQSGVSMKEFLGKGSKNKKGFRRSTIDRLAKFFESARLRSIAQSDIFWDEIIAISPMGIEDTFDLTVEKDHNFVAEGIIVHNSHSAAYAHVGYQTAYLKAHYTPEFMAALLTSEIEDGNKRDIMVDHFDDAKRLGYPVQPPNVNEDFPDFTVVKNKIRFGLVAIKGLGRGAAEEIVRARQEKGPFKDIFDFCERIDHRYVTKTVIEKLIKAGAMDCFGARRSQLMQVMPRAMDSANALQQDRRIGQTNLFDALGGDNGNESVRQEEALPNIPEWPHLEKLKYEKEVLDFYVSSHPLAQYEEMLSLFASHSTKTLSQAEPGREVLLGGMLTGLRFLNTKRARNGNTRYVRCKLEDFDGSVECVMWPDDLAKHKDRVNEDEICFVNAVVERDQRDPTQASLVLTRILTIEEAQRLRTTGVWIQLSLNEHNEDHLAAIERTLRRAPGKCPVFVRITDLFGRHCNLKVSADLAIDPNSFPRAELETILGKGRVSFSRHGNGK